MKRERLVELLTNRLIVMKQTNGKSKVAKSPNASRIEVLLIKVKDLTTGEMKKVDTAEYLMNMSNYVRVEA